MSLAVARRLVAPAALYTPSYDASANTLFGAMTVQPDATRKGLINALIVGLKADGLWSILDVLWIIAAHDGQAARLNWKSPSVFPLVPTGSPLPVFTTDRDYTGQGSTGYLATNWVPSTNAVNYTLNSATIFGWSRTAGQLATPMMGRANGLHGQITPRNTSDQLAFIPPNTDTTVSTTANTDGSGLFSISRTGASVTQAYRNGASICSVAVTAANAISVAQIALLRTNATVYSTGAIAAAGMGAGLDATQNTNLYARINTYLTAIGAA